MRIALVAWLVVAGACSSRDGTYLAIEGGKAGIRFDRVELYFGNGSATVIPRTPATASSVAAPPPGRRFNRQFSAATDRYDVGSTVGRLDYYLPAEKQDTGGRYVAIVAYAGQSPVGIGEVFDWNVPHDRLFEYSIALAPFDPAMVELWGDGTAPGCLRYTHPRAGEPDTVVVVRSNDLDCDAVIGHLDCEDLAYCPAGDPTCSGATTSQTCVTQDNGDCIIGTCVDGQGCVGDTCEIPGVCADPCLGLPDLDSQLACGVMQPLSHQDYLVPVTDVDTTETIACDPSTFVIDPPDANGAPVACSQPSIDSPFDGIVDGYQFAIAEDTQSTSCIVQITPATTPLTPWNPGDDRHILVSVDAGATGTPPRWSFIIGWKAGTVMTVPVCDGTIDTIVSTGSGATLSCAH